MLTGAYAPTYQVGTDKNGNPVFAGVFNGDGTGDFYYGVYWTGQDQGGGSNARSPLFEFSVAVGQISQSTSPLNDKGQLFVVDMLSGETGNTWPVDATTATVPEPGILILLGIAMSAVGAASWRIFKL